MPAIWLIILIVFWITMAYLSLDKIQQVLFLRKEKLQAQHDNDSHLAQKIEIAINLNRKDLFFILLLTFIISTILLVIFATSVSAQP